MSKDASTSISCSPFGCATTIVGLVVLWAGCAEEADRLLEEWEAARDAEQERRAA